MLGPTGYEKGEWIPKETMVPHVKTHLPREATSLDTMEGSFEEAGIDDGSFGCKPWTGCLLPGDRCDDVIKEGLSQLGKKTCIKKR